MKALRNLLGPIAALSLILAACGDDGTTEDTAGPTEAPDVTDADGADATPADGEAEGDPIRIGGTLGLTGAFSGPSAGYQAAYDFWLEEINTEGGLLGRPVEMIIYDDESTPATAQTLYQRLINEDQVDLVLAPYTTLIGGAILPIVEGNEMVLWNGGFVGIDLFQESDWIVGSYTYQEPDYPRGTFEIIDSLPEAERPTNVGVITSQNPFTLVVREGFEGEGGVLNFAEERGMEVVLDEQYAPDTADFSSLVERAQSADVEAFFALTLPNDGGLIARAAHEAGFEPTIYCSCGSQVTSLPFWDELGPAGRGVMATSMAWETDDYPGMEELLPHFQETLGYEEMPAYGTVSYAILQVLQQAVEGAGTLDQAELRDYVTNQTFDTINGPMEYDENRIPSYTAIQLQVVDDEGTNEVVWPGERATADPQIPMP